ncbi:unnamed product [Ostreococcus tauri]|uniref:Unnamed product n=1 Tax=Ostreococcus tauri TaxID=70448 RepID=A0A096P7D1_OSTTA|nr:unnamed product [Ostreococcus tauri]CEG00060.1 unnamed product [Ostreococcus tauri]|eukprot:XP_003082557.2 unnamed product [Ostreococcus tauri]
MPRAVLDGASRARGRGRMKTIDRDATTCGACARAFERGVGKCLDEEETVDGTGSTAATGRTQRGRRFASTKTPEIGPICRACYQREYRERKGATPRGENRCARCGATETSGKWCVWRGGDGREARADNKAETLCQRCYDVERWSASVKKRAEMVAEDDEDGARCARCDRKGTGSASTAWYRAEGGDLLGRKVCKACHLLDYRERMNNDPKVYCHGCAKTELSTRQWRRRKGGGHWCDACYKRDRLDKMNADPEVFCVTCRSQTSGGPEWRRKGEAYQCRTCLSAERNARKRLEKASAVVV